MAHRLHHARINRGDLRVTDTVPLIGVANICRAGVEAVSSVAE